MKKIVGVLIVALFALTACSPKHDVDKKEPPKTEAVTTQNLKKAIDELLEVEVISYIFRLSNETHLLSEEHTSLNNLNDFPNAKMIDKTMIEDKVLTTTYINEGYIYHDFIGGQLKEKLTHETLDEALGHNFDINDVSYELMVLSKDSSFYDAKNFKIESKDGGTLFVLDKEDDNANVILSSYKPPLVKSEGVIFNRVSFLVKDSKLIEYTIEFTSEGVNGRQDRIIVAVGDDVKFEFPDFSTYMEIPS